MCIRSNKSFFRLSTQAFLVEKDETHMLFSSRKCVAIRSHFFGPRKWVFIRSHNFFRCGKWVAIRSNNFQFRKIWVGTTIESQLWTENLPTKIFKFRRKKKPHLSISKKIKRRKGKKNVTSRVNLAKSFLQKLQKLFGRKPKRRNQNQKKSRKSRKRLKKRRLQRFEII